MKGSNANQIQHHTTPKKRKFFINNETSFALWVRTMPRVCLHFTLHLYNKNKNPTISMQNAQLTSNYFLKILPDYAMKIKPAQNTTHKIEDVQGTRTHRSGMPNQRFIKVDKFFPMQNWRFVQSITLKQFLNNMPQICIFYTECLLEPLITLFIDKPKN